LVPSGLAEVIVAMLEELPQTLREFPLCVWHMLRCLADHKWFNPAQDISSYRKRSNLMRYQLTTYGT